MHIVLAFRVDNQTLSSGKGSTKGTNGTIAVFSAENCLPILESPTRA
jgi:hypothetical protein